MWSNDQRIPQSSYFGGLVNGLPEHVYECTWDDELFVATMNTETSCEDIPLDRENAVKLREALDAFIEGRS